MFLPQGAQAGPGELDPRFGNDGRVRTTVAPTDGDLDVKFQMARADHGAIVVARQRTLLRYLPNGKLDRAFGASGAVLIERPVGFVFRIADIDVDVRGRILVVGTSLAADATVESTNPGSQPLGPQRLVTALRYLPDGSLDPTFGGGDGVVLTTFGLPPPPGYDRPSVSATDVLVDREGRILLAGTTLLGVGNCKTLTGHDLSSFVARLTEAGDLDPSFGDGEGHVAVDGLEAVTQIALAPHGRIVLLGLQPGGAMCGGDLTSIVRLVSNGEPDERFGFRANRRDYSLRSAQRVAVDRRGRVLLLGGTLRPYLPGGRRGHGVVHLLRLGANGRPDRAFGRRGRSVLQLPGSASTLADLATAHDGGILLAGSLALPDGRGRDVGSLPSARAFTVIRLRPSGRADRRFGRGGWAITGFGRRLNALAMRALIDSSGRLLVGGLLARPGQALIGRVALARYRVGRSSRPAHDGEDAVVTRKKTGLGPADGSE